MPPRKPSGDPIGCDKFLALANDEIAHYRSIDPDVAMHAVVLDDVSGVMVAGDTLLIGPETSVARERVHALLQHEVGTHLVTQATVPRSRSRCWAPGWPATTSPRRGSRCWLRSRSAS